VDRVRCAHARCGGRLDKLAFSGRIGKKALPSARLPRSAARDDTAQEHVEAGHPPVCGNQAALTASSCSAGSAPVAPRRWTDVQTGDRAAVIQTPKGTSVLAAPALEPEAADAELVEADVVSELVRTDPQTCSRQRVGSWPKSRRRVSRKMTMRSLTVSRCAPSP